MAQEESTYIQGLGEDGAGAKTSPVAYSIWLVALY